MKKVYSCPLDIEFPDAEEERTNILKRIEKIVTTAQKSTIDMDYIKDLFVEENAEELALLDFNEDADLTKDVPWDLVTFRAESLTRGSTILNFSITFKQPPRNPNDVCAYTVIELLIKTTIENLNFIDRIEEKSSSVRDDNRMMLHARFKVDKENFLTDKVDDILKKLRETIKMISEDSSSESADISPETALENPLRELSLNNFISAANPC